MSETVWLFDLDSMLHNADAGIFCLINRRMVEHLASRLDLPEEEASCLRRDYWHRYGATLAGLQIRHSEVDVGSFPCRSHLLGEVLARLTPVEGTEEALGRLKGRKTIFSNGPSFYVRTIANALGLERYFDLLAGTEDFGPLYRPNRHAYLNVYHLLATHPAACIMVDDSADNLHAARILDMRTMWFSWHAHPLSFTDTAVSDTTTLAEWGGSVEP